MPTQSAAAHIPISVEELFSSSPLTSFVSIMRDVIALRDAIEVTRDAALRNTDGMADTAVAARTQLAGLAAKLLANRLEIELNNALQQLETYYNGKAAASS